MIKKLLILLAIVSFFLPAVSHAAKSFQVDTSSTLTTSLVSFWSLYTTSTDLWGPNNGTDSNITYSSNKAVFNGSNSTITTNGTGFPTGAGARSISFWVNFASVSGANATFGYGTNSTDEGMSIYFNPPSSNTQIDIYNHGAATNHSLASSTNYHFIFVYPGSGTVWTVYKNNDAGTTLDTGFAPNTTGTSNKMGELFYSTGFPLNASMWDVGIWSKTLSATERSNLYNSGSGDTLVDAVVSTAPQMQVVWWDGE